MYKLIVEPRDPKSRSNNSLRRAGLIPAVYYHHGEKSIPLLVTEKEFKKMIDAHDSVIKLSNGKMAIIKTLDKDPFGKILHLNLEGVVSGETFHKSIPIIVNYDEEKSSWHKSGMILRHPLNSVDIETTPEHLPEYIEIDVTDVPGDSIVRVKDLKVAGYKILTDPESEIASFGFPHVSAEPELEVKPVEEIKPEAIPAKKEED